MYFSMLSKSRTNLITQIHSPATITTSSIFHQELIRKANEEIAKLQGQVSTLEGQVRLLQERRKGSRPA